MHGQRHSSSNSVSVFSLEFLLIFELILTALTGTSAESSLKIQGLKGGMPGSEEMFKKDTIYISKKMRPLFRNPASGLYRSDFKFQEVTVCFAKRVDFDKNWREYSRFVCPEPDGYVEAASHSDLVSRAESKSYCCGNQPYQWCCSFAEYSGKDTTKSQGLSKVLIAVICISVFSGLVFIILFFFCICRNCCKQKPRNAAQPPQQPYQGSPRYGTYQQPQHYGGYSQPQAQPYPQQPLAPPQQYPLPPPMPPPQQQQQQQQQQYPPPPPAPSLYPSNQLAGMQQR